MAYNSKRDERASAGGGAGRRFNSFRWLDNPASYQTAAGQIGSGVIPLLAPAQPHRRKRWEEILGWYGLEPHVEGEASSPAPDFKSDGDEVVVGFDDEYGPAAALLAAATGRRLIVAPARDPLSTLRAAARADSIVFVGRPSNLHKANIYSIARALEVPWGVLTASDLPAMSFLLAKQVADFRLPHEGTLLLDAPTERVEFFDSDARAGSDSLTDGESLHRLLTTQSFTDMVIHAHGEGAHANLKSAVLCGLVGESESWPGGALAKGCRQVRAKRFCKRASRQRRHVFSFGDLKARHLYLLSCNGFTIAKEVYPTNVSAVLAAVEGYAASVLTTDRTLGLDPRLAELALQLIRQGVGLSAIRRTLNRIMMFQSGTSPFILCGDPFGSNSITSENSSNGSFPIRPGEAVRLIDLKDWGTAKVIGLEKNPPELTLFRGAGLGVVRSDGTKRRRVKIEDFSARWETHLERLKTLARRHVRVSRSVAVIKDFWPDAHKSSVEFQTRLEELESIGRKLSVNVARGLRVLDNILGDGVWDPRMKLLSDVVERQAGYWDQCFARVVEGHILDNDFAPLFLHDELRRSNDSGEHCPRCGVVLIVIEAADSLDGRVATVATECPSCGPLEVWQVGGARFIIKGEAEIHPGEVYSLRVEEKRTSEPATFEPSPAYIIAQFQDLGGKPFFSEIASPKNGKVRFDVPVPPNCAFDMQTLRIARVQGLTVSGWRLPYACTPGKRSPRENSLGPRRG